MLNSKITNQFQKDYYRLYKRRKNMEKLDEIMALIALEEPLPNHCRPHILSGDWNGYWECHVESDWVLIYDLDIIELGDSFLFRGNIV